MHDCNVPFREVRERKTEKKIQKETLFQKKEMVHYIIVFLFKWWRKMKEKDWFTFILDLLINTV